MRPTVIVVIVLGLVVSSCATSSSVSRYMPAEGCYERLLDCDPAKAMGVFREYASGASRVRVALTPLAKLVATRGATSGSSDPECSSEGQWSNAQVASVIEIRDGSAWSANGELLKSNLVPGKSWETVKGAQCTAWRTVTNMNENSVSVATEFRCGRGVPNPPVTTEDWTAGEGVTRISSFGRCLVAFRRIPCPSEWWLPFVLANAY